MIRQIFVGLVTEGPTDNRFLESVVKRTFENIAFECKHDVDTYIRLINVKKVSLNFVEYIEAASKAGMSEIGVMTLGVHTDADRDTYEERIKNKIEPVRNHLAKLADAEYCKLITPIIPVRMIEAWMLADKQLLREEIGTDMSDNELGINKDPEMIADPKAVIERAIKIATAHLPKRRQRLSIAELYSSIGTKIEIEALLQLTSYRKFQEEVRETYRALNYM